MLSRGGSGGRRGGGKMRAFVRRALGRADEGRAVAEQELAIYRWSVLRHPGAASTLWYWSALSRAVPRVLQRSAVTKPEREPKRCGCLGKGGLQNCD